MYFNNEVHIVLICSKFGFLEGTLESTTTAFLFFLSIASADEYPPVFPLWNRIVKSASPVINHPKPKPWCSSWL